MPDGPHKPPPPLLLDEAVEMARALRDLKSIGDARDPRSVADRLFAGAWRALVAGAEADAVALSVCARALVATRLGAIDAAVLTAAGLGTAAIARIETRALTDALPACCTRGQALHAGLDLAATDAAEPAFVQQLARQPRAGATASGKPRLILTPQESHAGHCLVVAALGVLIAPADARPGPILLAGLSHHLHNAELADSGFAGEILLGDHLDTVVAGLRERALAQVPPPLAADARAALALCVDAASPEGRAFNAADVIDRVEEMRHHARVSAFRVEHALDEMELVHAGPLQAFQKAVLASARMS